MVCWFLEEAVALLQAACKAFSLIWDGSTTSIPAILPCFIYFLSTCQITLRISSLSCHCSRCASYLSFLINSAKCQTGVACLFLQSFLALHCGVDFSVSGLFPGSACTNNKKSILKGYILYDSNYITFWKQQNYEDSKRISGCQGLRGREG